MLGRTDCFQNALKLKRMRTLLRDVQQKAENRSILRLKFFADQSLKAMFRDQIAVPVQPCRGHDEQTRHLVSVQLQRFQDIGRVGAVLRNSPTTLSQIGSTAAAGTSAGTRTHAA